MDERGYRPPSAGSEQSIERIAFAAVYFAQGGTGFSRLAIRYFLKDELMADPSLMSIIGGLHSLAWSLKPAYGLLSDTYPIFGSKRRSYLVLCGLLGAVVWVMLGTFPPSLFILQASIFFEAIASAFSDVVVDSMVVTRARDAAASSAGSLQSLCWAAKAVGSITSACASGYLVSALSARAIFLSTAALPLLTAATSLAVSDTEVALVEPKVGETREAVEKDMHMGILGAGHRRGGGHEAGAASGAFTDPVGPVRLERGASGRRYPGAVVPKDAAGVRGVPVALETECGDAMASTPGSLHRGSPVAHAGPAMAHSAWDKLEQLRRAMLDRRILLPVAFLFVWVVIPSPSSAMFFFYVNALHFSKRFMGLAAVVGSAFTLLGILLFHRFFKATPIRKLLLWVALIGLLLHLGQVLLVTRANLRLGIPDPAFVLTDRALLAALHELGHMPLLVLAARICPEGIEATMFAAVMSVSNLAGLVSSLLNAACVRALGITSRDFWGLPALVVLCSLMHALPVPLLRLVPDVGAKTAGALPPRRNAESDAEQSEPVGVTSPAAVTRAKHRAGRATEGGAGDVAVIV